jgi:hypothetical protein
MMKVSPSSLCTHATGLPRLTGVDNSLSEPLVVGHQKRQRPAGTRLHRAVLRQRLERLDITDQHRYVKDMQGKRSWMQNSANVHESLVTGTLCYSQT